MKANHLGITRGACVCCNITSLTRIAQGSRVWRHGRSRSRGNPHCRTSVGPDVDIVVRPPTRGHAVAVPHINPATEVPHLWAVLVEAFALDRDDSATGLDF